ncbi:carboxylesterase family protein [Orbus wheelerorum]|uniref:carboxylesterase/lipase family protein n=1 Tax=Orbus wheelerorum TaxID=3074111 RepID=UPI00370DDCF1
MFNKLLLLILTLISCNFFTLADINNQVQIENGKIEGIYNKDRSIAIFKGIPYAKAPINNLRWKKPQKLENWDNIKYTVVDSDGCIQNRVKGDKLPWTKEFLHQGLVSEDCLYLNIWAPVKSKKELPVIIYLHGGGFVEGSTNVAIYDGENLAKQDVIFVSFNYRLGIFGMMAHPSLTKEEGKSGNYTFYDQIAAIQWVKNNIKQFGGDPNNITLLGQSAGANSIMLLNASPLTRNLYNKAIMLSAPGTTISDYGIHPTDNIQYNLSDVEKKFSNWATKFNYLTLDSLRAAPALELLANFTEDTPFKGAVIDGEFLPDTVTNLYKNQSANKIDIMAGTVWDERGSEKEYNVITINELHDYIDKFYPKNKDRVFNFYQPTNNLEARENYKKLLRDQNNYAMQWLANQRISSTHNANYLYVLKRAIPWPEHGTFGAFHSSDLPYFLNNLDKLDRPWTENDININQSFINYMINFVKTGEPNDKNSNWKPFNKNGFILCFDEIIGPCPKIDIDILDMISHRDN